MILECQLFGAFWYLFSIESEIRCWRGSLKSTEYKGNEYLSCHAHNQNEIVTSLLTSTCAVIDPSQTTNSTTFNFGIYADALQSGVVSSTMGFPQKFFYCFWWGLRNLRFVNHILVLHFHFKCKQVSYIMTFEEFIIGFASTF